MGLRKARRRPVFIEAKISSSMTSRESQLPDPKGTPKNRSERLQILQVLGPLAATLRL